MPHFGPRSKLELNTCHPKLQKLFNEVIKYVDCTIICGYRDEFDQTKAFQAEKSMVRYPNSKHNKMPSLAVDVIPYPTKWGEIKVFYMFVGIVRGIAAKMKIKIRCGADWDGDMQIKDQNFHDLAHFELID